MPHLLRIDASARLSGSVSRDLGDVFAAAWTARPGHALSRRDLAWAPVPHIDQPTIAGFFSPAEAQTPELRAATALSDTLIAEVQAADALLITTAMYNFGVPSALKAWIDHVVRIHRTVAFDGRDFAGIAHPRRAIVVAAYGAGGYEAGARFAAADFVTPYLRHVLGFIGIPSVEAVVIQATNADPAGLDGALAAARVRLRELAMG